MGRGLRQSLRLLSAPAALLYLPVTGLSPLVRAWGERPPYRAERSLLPMPPLLRPHHSRLESSARPAYTAAICRDLPPHTASRAGIRRPRALRDRALPARPLRRSVMGVSFSLNDEERQWLSRLARESITTALEGREDVPPPLPSALAGGTLAQSLGSFVTLNKDGALRGCIGNMVGREPLWQNVWRMARAAAFEDPRFPALDAAEWPHCHLHISVLGPLSPCPDPARIVIGRHGLLLRLGMRQGVFLPQVPVEQGWDLGQYLEHLCRKAGLPAGSWRDPQALLFWFESLVFEA